MRLATCPMCGNDKDGTIFISATCTAIVEEHDQFNYIDGNVDDRSHTECQHCGHHSSFYNFKLGVTPPSSDELGELERWLLAVAKRDDGLHSSLTAKRCIGLLKLLAIAPLTP